MTENGEVVENNNCDSEEKSLQRPLKHPLHSSWTFWFYQSDKSQNDKQKTWEKCQIIVGTFSTVEDFWAIYNYVYSASMIPVGCDYSLFKTGIKPMWEDIHNKNGGRWLVSFPRGSKHELDYCWLELMLCLIGEAFDDDGDEISGAVVASRGKADKIGLWTANYKKSQAIMNIGKIVKDRLGLTRCFGYQSHEEAASRMSSKTSDLFTV